ncbi:hypothetical protein ACWDXV_34050 [Nocardia nova]
MARPNSVKLLPLKVAAASAVFAAAGAAFAPAIASAGTYLGGVDMNAYCSWRYEGATARVLDPNSAYSWSCMHGPVVAGPVNVDVQCRHQYPGTPGAYSGLRNSRDPYSWYCQR